MAKVATKKATKKASKVATKKVAKKTTQKAAKKATKMPTKKTGAKSLKNATRKSAKGGGKQAGTQKRTKKVTKKAAKSRATEATLERQMSQVRLGGIVPEILLPGTGDKEFRLSDLRGKRVVLYFYPKDSTPGCTQEGHDFTALHKEFQAANTEVYGISRDSVKSHKSFRDKQQYSFDLLSDGDEKVCRLLGVMQPKTLYGRKFMGVERSTFVINERGELVKEWRQVQVSGHAEEVLAFVKSLAAKV